MHYRILTLIILAICLCLVNLQAVNPFSKRIANAVNHLEYVNPDSTVHTEAFFSYTQTQPALIDSILSVTTTTTNSDVITTVSISRFESNLQTIGDLTRVEYFEYRDDSIVLYGYFKFVFNQDGDLVEFIQQHPTLFDSLHVDYSYHSINQPDSIYYKTCTQSGTTLSYYKLNYDFDNRLIASYWYLNTDNDWNLFRRWISSYNNNPYQYPNSLDYNNVRFYNLFWAGFESTSPIIDKNYAPTSISYDYWDSDNNTWYASPTTYYGVDADGDEIIILNGRFNEYNGYYCFDQEGKYTHTVNNRANGSVFSFYVNWEENTETEDNTIIPLKHIISVSPNPFQTNLLIKFTDLVNVPSDISIYNIKGQLVRSWKGLKAEEITWDGKDLADKPVSRGVYLIRARQGNKISYSKVIKLK